MFNYNFLSTRARARSAPERPFRQSSGIVRDGFPTRHVINNRNGLCKTIADSVREIFLLSTREGALAGLGGETGARAW